MTSLIQQPSTLRLSGKKPQQLSVPSFLHKQASFSKRDAPLCELCG